MAKISIQGYEGSFHQEAARLFFGETVEVIPCATFREVVKVAANKNQSDGGIMAIENSIAGCILPNYDLLQKSKLNVVGEVYLAIRQNLMVNHGVKLEDIKEVHSHPMALQQCFDFLDQHNWKLVEKEDTALSAKHIQQYKSKHIAAIASKIAAELYDLNIISPSIESMKNNYTRFLILKKEAYNENVNPDKASICFSVENNIGSLSKVLNIITERGVNLSKLQSFPISGSNFKYSFHVDLEFENLPQFNELIESIKPLTVNLKIYGIYKKAKMNFLN